MSNILNRPGFPAGQQIDLDDVVPIIDMTTGVETYVTVKQLLDGVSALRAETNDLTGLDTIITSGRRAKTSLPLVGDLSKSVLGNVPLTVSSDAVTVTLGPTAQANATSEYNTEKSGKIEWPFVVGGEIANRDKLFAFSTAGLQLQSTWVIVQSAPMPTTGNPGGWWSKGAIRFACDGEGVVLVSYVRNTTNACQVIVDGERISGSDANGVISNSVASTSNARQWVKISLTGDKHRVITLNGPYRIMSIVHSPGVTLSAVPYAGKAIAFGDSFAGRYAATGEANISRDVLISGALELLGYDVINAASGGTGFVNDGGGAASSKGSYLDYINHYKTYGSTIGFDASQYSLILLFGSGNDGSGRGTVDAYSTVIKAALDTFQNAVVVITTVYEGFNLDADAATLNANLIAAADLCAGTGRVIVVPVDKVHKVDGVGVWSGTGSVPAPAGDGNADVYFSNVAQGSADRHPNTLGCSYAARFYAREMIRAGVPYSKV